MIRQSTSKLIHFIKEKVHPDVICISYLLTTEQTSDMLTKGLSERQLINFLEIWLPISYKPASGGVLDFLLSPAIFDVYYCIYSSFMSKIFSFFVVSLSSKTSILEDVFDSFYDKNTVSFIDNRLITNTTKTHSTRESYNK